jgi:hypothetical protein
MKRSFTVTLIALLISASAFSQQNFPKNEVKLNLTNTVFLLYPEISYERILDYDISVGASLGFGGEEYYAQSFNFTPYFRWFFGGNRETMNKAGAGFFIEANSSLYSYKTYGDWADDNELNAGIGLGIGWKYLSRNCWVGEFMFGAGRGTDNTAYPRIGLSIGRRF